MVKAMPSDEDILWAAFKGMECYEHSTQRKSFQQHSGACCRISERTQREDRQNKQKALDLIVQEKLLSGFYSLSNANLVIIHHHEPNIYSPFSGPHSVVSKP